MVDEGNTPQSPIRTRGARKFDVRTQFAAICYRNRKRGVEILLITSRESGRWVVPKGWPMDGRTPAATAAQEAFEEAGVIGKAGERVVGLYSYQKSVDKDDLPCVVAVFPVEVRELAEDFPEKNQRKRKWFTAKKAAAKVREPELGQIIRGFAAGLKRH